MNDYCQIFKQIIRNSNYDNTYKMAWAKALVEISAEVNLNDELIKYFQSENINIVFTCDENHNVINMEIKEL